MKTDHSATVPGRVAPQSAIPSSDRPDTGRGQTPASSSQRSGALQAFLGVLAFSFSFPGTALALDSFGPWSATGLRGIIAALLAGGALLLTRSPVPARQDWGGIAVVAVGCAVGFPLLTTLALQTSSTAHSAVVVGALPLATAAISAGLTRRSPSPVFWAAACAGGLVVILFALWQNHGRPTVGDLFLFGALLLCAAGYAEGGRLSRHLPGWKVIGWGVVLALPVNVVVTAIALPLEPVHLTARGMLGLAYIAAVSQFLGFVVWYRGMGILGVAKASQLQLMQPLLTLVWSVLLMGEHFSATVPIAAVLVLACVLVTQRART